MTETPAPPHQPTPPPAPTNPPPLPPVVELTGAIRLDDATCYNTPDNGVLIEPGAQSVRWLAFWLLAALGMLLVMLWVLSLLSLAGSVLGVLGWLVRTVVLTALVIGVGLLLYPQWLALRKPAFSIVPADELVEVERARSIRRIPFTAITSLRIAADPVENPLDRVLNWLFDRMNVQRRGIGLVLKHGEVVWCGVLSGEDARDRARRIRQRISQSIASHRAE